MSIDEALTKTPAPVMLCESPLARRAIADVWVRVADSNEIAGSDADSCAAAAAFLVENMNIAIDGPSDINEVATYFGDINHLTHAGVPDSTAAHRDEVLNSLNSIRKHATARLAGWTVRHDEYANPVVTNVLAALASRLK